jgi:hypothetical protein
LANSIKLGAAPIGPIGAAVLLTLPLAATVLASPDGAEWETASNPIACRNCHLDSPDLSQSQALSIEGLPRKPEAGRSYELTIVLRDPALENAGFLLSIRSDSAMAGELLALDKRTEVNGTQARSNYDSSSPEAPGKASWQLVWTAPDALDGPLRFDLWGNAGNYDLSPLGDRAHHRIWYLPLDE